MFLSQEPVQPLLPDFSITGDEIQELLAFLETEEPASSNSGSDELNRPVHTTDERKNKRMISNRESARRSRWRKKRQLENLTDEVTRLSLENQELKNRLALVLNYCHLLRRENDRLRSESVCLRARLLDLYQILVAIQSQKRCKLEL